MWTAWIIRSRGSKACMYKIAIRIQRLYKYRPTASFTGMRGSYLVAVDNHGMPHLMHVDCSLRNRFTERV